MASVSDNTSAPDGPSTTSWCVSELLCFVTDKCNVLPVDDLVKICVDFYSESEIITARNMVDSAGVRLPKSLRNRSSDRLRWKTSLNVFLMHLLRCQSSMRRIWPDSRQWMYRTVMFLRYCWSSVLCVQRSVVWVRSLQQLKL